MSNPWLKISLSDYEEHMQLPEVRQLGVLSALFGEAIAFCRPSSVAILGIAGGNELERIDTSHTKRIVGFDINPAYLKALQGRSSHVSGLELYCVDLAKQIVTLAPVQLVHAALIFEHAGVDRCFENALSLIAPGGALSVVLQLPCEAKQGVSTTQFPSIQKLRSHFFFVDPDWLRTALEKRGLRLRHYMQRSLPSGKGLWMGIFGHELKELRC